MQRASTPHTKITKSTTVQNACGCCSDSSCVPGCAIEFNVHPAVNEELVLTGGEDVLAGLGIVDSDTMFERAMRTTATQSIVNVQFFPKTENVCGLPCTIRHFVHF